LHISLGVDTLCYHCRLSAGDIDLPRVIDEVADIGYSFIQFNTVHLERYDTDGLRELRRRATSRGLGVTLAGSNVGRAADGDTVESGLSKVLAWGGVAQALGSDYVRVSSGFYRTEMFRDGERIGREREYVIRVLTAVASEFERSGLKILLENHSDFTLEEYLSIIEGVSAANFEVFLDLINPITMLQDPGEVVEALLPYARAGHVKDYSFVSHYVEDGYHRRGYEVQYCYPGEGVADLDRLVGLLAADPRPGEFRLSVEGLDNHPDTADQIERLAASLDHLRRLV